ncbi:MAG TPA: hypothetical protein VJ836_05565 [Candidatus Saccharimonadales bacterium]|nr:hypothetical protein [Candidatus Saccharimonadales bacterium]
MKSKKSPKPTKTEKDWQKKVEERAKVEKLELDHPKGKERFEQVVNRIGKKKD